MEPTFHQSNSVKKYVIIDMAKSILNIFLPFKFLQDYFIVCCK